jgi:hypothetical protein
MKYRVTVRYDGGGLRYHVETVEASDLRGALEQAARGLPEDVASRADLAEIRPAVDPEDRSYVGD